MAMKPDEILAEMIKVYGLNGGRAQAWIEGLQDHLSAQARVRVIDDEPTQVATQLFTEYFVKNYPGPDTIICDPNWHAPRIFRAAVSSIERAYAGPVGQDFAARLSQGAQGEAKCHRCGATSEDQAETMCIPDGDSCPGCEKPLSDQWKAERAAAPDGWKITRTDDAIFPVRIAGPEGHVWHPEGGSPAARLALALLTAAPQPPEGALVVDDWQPIESAPTDGTIHVRGLWVRTPRGSYFDAVVGGINDEGQFVDLDHDSTRWDASDYTHWHRLSAAPTLAGTERMP